MTRKPVGLSGQRIVRVDETQILPTYLEAMQVASIGANHQCEGRPLVSLVRKFSYLFMALEPTV
jgi:hypothetical protein